MLTRLTTIAFLIAPLWGTDIRLRLGNQTVVIPLETYVAGVLAGESGGFRSTEALKAMAVAARTYGVRGVGRHGSQGYDLCATTHCQYYDTRSLTPRVQAAVDETEGELLWYEGKVAFATYSRNCGGRTEAGSEAYLKSHDDPYCAREPWEFSATGAEIVNALLHSGLHVPQAIDRIAVSERTGSGRAQTVALSGRGESTAMSGQTLRLALGRSLGWTSLRSESWNVRTNADRFVFQGKGGGHGIGLCQIGADQMGAGGNNYRKILSFYYPGTKVGLTGAGLDWTRLAGQWTTLLTMRPDRDRPLLAEAERLRQSIELRSAVELRVYPDVATFRNATGEPGWVAAVTQGHRIHLQPSSSAATLRHEFLHIMVEEQAAPGLPVWFREGLVGVLAHENQGPALAIEDLALRQRTDPKQARAGYAAAVRRVSELVSKYGQATVMGWLKTGLPARLPVVRT